MSPRKLLAENLLLAMLPVFLLLLVVGGGLLGVVLPMLEEENLKQKRLQSQLVIDAFFSTLDVYQQRVRDGEISDSTAKARAAALLGAVRYGHAQTGYLWIIGSDGRLLVHTVMPQLVGGNPDFLMGPDGQPLVRILENMRGVAGANPEGGYVRYLWKHQGERRQTSEKLSYVRAYAPWGWVLGTGVYLDDVRDEFQRIRQQLLLGGGALLLLMAGLSLALSRRAYRMQKHAALLFWEARAQEERFQTLLATIPVGAVLQDAKGVVQEVNAALQKMTGLPRERMVGQTLEGCGVLTGPVHAENGQVTRTLLSAAGETRIVVVPESPEPLPGQNPPLYVTTLLDVTDVVEMARSNVELKNEIAARSEELAKLDQVVQGRQDDLKRLRKQLTIAGRIFEAAGDGVIVADSQAMILSVNPAFTAITGYATEDVLGRNPRLLQSSRHGPDFYKEMWDSLLTNHHFASEIWNRRKNGEAFPCHIDITAVTSDEGTVTEYIAIFKDLSDLQRSRDQLAHLHDHDPLTGLPNRQSFVAALYASCAHAGQNESHLAVAILGIDRFSRINKTEGYLVGDQLLHAVGKRLRSVVPDSLMLGRFAGDEFACAIPFKNKTWDALQILEKMKAALLEPFKLAEQEVSVTACIGVSFYPNDTADPEALTRLASLSLDRAKQEHPNTLRLFTDDLNEALGRRLALETDLRHGIEREEFIMYFQPKINVGDGTVSGAEALMRWFRPDGTMVPPNEFIAVAEEVGEIDRLGLIALRQACHMARAMEDAGTPVRIAVNVSPKQLFTHGFTSQVLRIMDMERLDPRWLELEITESAVMEDLNRATRIMGELVVEGLQFTLDDFGTGYSSLSHIRTLPIGGFKIDRSFVMDLADNTETQSICSLFMKLARDLHMELTVEGVETAAQMEFLQQFPEASIQGFYYSKPLSPQEFRNYVAGKAT